MHVPKQQTEICTKPTTTTTSSTSTNLKEQKTKQKKLVWQNL